MRMKISIVNPPLGQAMPIPPCSDVWKGLGHKQLTGFQGELYEGGVS